MSHDHDCVALLRRRGVDEASIAAASGQEHRHEV